MISKLEAKNLFSYESLELDFQSGITAIDGFNYDDNCEEGSGKSSIGNIICWTLFGKIPKDAKIDEVIREGQKSGMGLVELASGHKIFRSRKPNDLVIILEDQQHRGKDSKETQTMVESLLGFSFETFVQSVYFAQNYPKRFITANEAEKVQILSEILDLDQFDKARKEVMELIKVQKPTKDKLEYEINLNKNNLQNNKNNLEESDKTIKKLKLDSETQISEVSSEIQELVEHIEELDKAVAQDTTAAQKDYEELEANENSLNEQRAELRQLIRNIENEKSQKQRLVSEYERAERSYINMEKELSRLQTNKNSKSCPMCGTTSTNHVKHIEAQMLDISNSMNEALEASNELKTEIESIKILKPQDLYTKIAVIDDQLSKSQDIRKMIRDKIKEYEKLELDKKYARRRLGELDTSLTKLKAQKPWEDLEAQKQALNKNIKELESQLSAKVNIFNNLEQNIAQLEELKDAFKHIKGYVFQNVLEELTRRANDYLSELFEVPICLEFSNVGDGGDINKILVDVKLDNNSRPLGLYSGGQARRLQLAVDLALSDIISARSDKPASFRILDEAFKDLSEVSMEKALRLLQKFKGTTILIEHNSLFKSAVGRTLRVELRDGVSTLCQ